jgi:phosphocarrier protein
LPDPEALHARPATCIAQAASKFRSEITIRRENSDEVNAKSPLDILLLAALQGTRMTIRACGEDAEQALVEVVDAFRGVFAERMTGVPANREAGR